MKRNPRIHQVTGLVKLGKMKRRRSIRENEIPIIDVDEASDDLYTDADPSNTIPGLKFATVADAEASVSKIKKSGKKHAHKVQAAVAMEQRAKAAGKKSAAGVYRSYINSVKKESMIRSFVKQILIEATIDEEMWEVSKSPIHGVGVYSTIDIPAGTNLGVAHVKKPNGRYDITELGHNHNHSYNPNCVNKMIDNVRYLFAIDDIPAHSEITVDYTKQKDLEQPKPGWS